MNDTVVLSCQQLNKSFVETGHTINVLQGLDIEVRQGKTLGILGTSGSGKSTLLHLLSGLDKPTSGEVFWQEKPISQLSEKQKCHLRNQSLGFIYQFHHLLPEFTALENVAMPLLIRNENSSLALDKASSLLKSVGLSERMTHKPGQLSGGERQRVAIARALVTDPACVLADEPTGNLDPKTADAVVDVMLELQASLRTSFVMVTHNIALTKRLDCYFYLKDGKLLIGTE